MHATVDSRPTTIRVRSRQEGISGMRLPDEDELISALGEPRLRDERQPWTYNTLSFDLVSGEDRVELEISPSYGDLSFVWSRDGVTLVTLQASDVQYLSVEHQKAREYVVARFIEASSLRPMRIQVRPSVSLFWGTEP
jgi:hypothetical protein